MSALRACIASLDLIHEQAETPTATSLIRSFSLFSLFRGRPAKDVGGSSWPASYLRGHASESPLFEKASAAVARYNLLIRDIKAAAPRMSEDYLAEGLGRALAHCLEIVSLLLQMSAEEEATSATSRSSCRIALQSAFDIRSELASRPLSASNAVSEFDRHILSASVAPTSQHFHLGHLFARAREAILHLGHAVRESTSKGRSIPPGSSTYYTARPPNHDVLWLMDLLHSFSQRVVGLDDLGYLEEGEAMPLTVPKRVRRQPLSARQQAAVLKSQAAARRVKALRTSMEADVLRCELALSMANVTMNSVIRRASARGSAAQAPGAVSPPPKPQDASVDLDDEDLELVRASTIGENTGVATQEEPVHDETSGIEWESIAEQALLDSLVSATTCVWEGHPEALIAHVTLSDWIQPAICGSGETAAGNRPQVPSLDRDSEAEDDDANSETDTDSSDESEDDRSHSCPLRTLVRLYDRFEEQRLAVWLTLSTSARGKMGWYLRGTDGSVGSAWDALGQRLLTTMDADDLLAYGLSGDKLDKWTQVESQNNKRRKRGRTTI